MMDSMTQERHRDPRLASPAYGGPGGDNLGSTRENAYRLLAAADAVIDQNLSDNPEDFLRCNRQDGGQ